MIYLDSIFAFELDGCNLEGSKINDRLYDGLLINNYNNYFTLSIHSDTFIGSFNKMIKIKAQNT